MGFHNLLTKSQTQAHAFSSPGIGCFNFKKLVEYDSPVLFRDADPLVRYGGQDIRLAELISTGFLTEHACQKPLVSIPIHQMGMNDDGASLGTIAEGIIQQIHQCPYQSILIANQS
jgi:hypothetical protein